MKVILSVLALLMCSVASATTLNTVKSISIIGGSVEAETLQIKMEGLLDEEPKNFFLGSAYKFVIDLDATTTLPRFTDFSGKVIASTTIISDVDRTRIIINLRKKAKSGIKVIKNRVFISFSDEAVSVESTKTPGELMQEIRKITAGNGTVDTAVELLNSLLLMPPNEFTEDAQEMVGDIYARLGQIEKAKAEDKVFLSLYPNSPNYTKVKQRLIALEIAVPHTLLTRAPRTPKVGQEKSVDGNISEYVYYSGSSSEGKSKTDQITAMTNFRTSGTYQSNENITKVTVRGGYSRNVLTGENKSVINLANIDYDNTFLDYGIKIGRQNPTMGIIGRFDGVVIDYGINDMTTAKLALGKPYISSSNSNRKTYSAAIQKIYPSGWVSTYYGNYQVADGYAEREAIGIESSYAKDGSVISMMSEYDALYRALNALMVQGSTSYDKYSPYFLIDKRKSPVLYGEKSLVMGYSMPRKSAFTTFGDVMNNSGLSDGEIFKFVNASTPYINTYVIGTGIRLNNTWGGNVNIQSTNMTATSDTVFIPTLDGEQSTIATEASGNIYSLNFQVLGDNVRRKGNSISAILSLSKKQNGSTKTFTLLDGETYERFRLDNQLSLIMNNNLSFRTSSLNYYLKINYRIDVSTVLEAQYGIVRTINSDTPNNTSQMFFVGMKHDF